MLIELNVNGFCNMITSIKEVKVLIRGIWAYYNYNFIQGVIN